MAITAAEMVKRMSRGISLGSTFETNSQTRTWWRTQKLLDGWWARGFRHVRIPTCWYGADVSTCRLEDALFMDQLKAVVDYALGKGFVVVLNAHHEDWLDHGYDGSDAMNGRFWQLWVDVALRFNYVAQDRLVLEILNEPRGVFGEYGKLPSPTDPGAVARTRRIMQSGFHGVRRVSATRIVACTTNGMGNVSTAPLVYPTAAELPGGGKDPYLMLHVHTYDKWSCCGEDGSWDEVLAKPDPIAALRADVDSRFVALAAWRDKLGGNAVIPIHLGEYGVGRKEQWKRDNALTREYYRRTTQRCLAHGISPCVWGDAEGWFCMERIRDGVVQFPLGLADAVFS